MNDDEPDLDLSWILEPSPAPPRGLAHLHSRLRRRRHRDRGAAAFLVVALIAGITLAVSTHGSHSRSLYVGPSATAAPNACAAGAPAVSGQARVGDAVHFTVIPPGYVATPTGLTAPVFGQGEQLKPAGTPDNGSLTGPSIVAAIEAQQPSASSPGNNFTVQGHPAYLQTDGTGTKEQVNLSWNPEPGLTISIQAHGIPTTTVETLAQTTSYTPGQLAPSVGDLGPVLSRADAIQAAIGTADPGPGLRVVTWLVTGNELAASKAAIGESGDNVIRDPYWVVYTSGTFPNDATPTLGAVRNGKGLYIAEVNAITGTISSTTSGGTDPTVPPEYASLVDHSTNQPCPSPSPTEPSLQPPITTPGAYPAGIATATAQIIQRHADVPYNPTVNVGSSQFANLDPVTAPPTATTPGALLGYLLTAAPTRSAINLITSPGTATGVRVDAAGDIGVLVGGGTNKPLHLYMVNRNVQLHPGMTITTAGPQTSLYPPGIPVGTITSVTANPGQSPIVTVTPTANPDSAATVTILRIKN